MNQIWYDERAVVVKVDRSEQIRVILVCFGGEVGASVG
jgi:hypothetical protein